MQESPDLAPFLEETFHGTSPTIAAQRAPRSAVPAASDMLTLGFEDELTEEEELVGFSVPSPASATQGMRDTALCLLKADMLSMDAPPDVQKLELESVKRERRTLMESLAALKADQGSAGNERQMSDIARLRHELKSKQEKVNELKQARVAFFQRLSMQMPVPCMDVLCNFSALFSLFSQHIRPQTAEMCGVIGSLHCCEVACATGSDEQTLCNPDARQTRSCPGAHEAVQNWRKVRLHQQPPLQQCNEHASCGHRKLQMQRGSWYAWPSQARIAQPLCRTAG